MEGEDCLSAAAAMKKKTLTESVKDEVFGSKGIGIITP